MIFRRIFEAETSTFSYLLGCERSRKAVLIDPVVSEVDHYIALLQSLNLALVYTLETHVHADHVTGAGLLRKKLGSKIVVHRDAGALCADLLVSDGVLPQVGDLQFEVRHMPGHTNGCVGYVMTDRVFTGTLFSLPPDTLVYPGHDYQGNTVSTIKQEMAKNARLGGGRGREAVIAIMRDLKLAYPRFIEQALPANQSRGLLVARD